MRRRAGSGRARKAGLPPGTVLATGDKACGPPRITCVVYDGAGFSERAADAAEAACPAPDDGRVHWINVDGVCSPELLERLGARFGLHPLLLEDVANTEQRPKLEDYGGHLFVELSSLRLEEGAAAVAVEQVSLVLGPNWLLSFNERPADWFPVIRDRLKADKARSRHAGPDYLAYSIVDAIVDGYYVVLERLGDRIEDLEEELLADPRPATLQAVYGMKREVARLRKSIWPLREVVSGLQREKDLVRESTEVYLRDLYDHTVQVIDSVETFRDVISGMLDLYLSSVSNRMNEVMKVLTVIATIFIPLTFVAGVYGMNFEFMPELKWRFGYLLFWTVIVALGAGMLLAFRRRKWL